MSVLGPLERPVDLEREREGGRERVGSVSGSSPRLKDDLRQTVTGRMRPRERSYSVLSKSSPKAFVPELSGRSFDFSQMGTVRVKPNQDPSPLVPRSKSVLSMPLGSPTMRESEGLKRSTRLPRVTAPPSLDPLESPTPRRGSIGGVGETERLRKTLDMRRSTIETQRSLSTSVDGYLSNGKAKARSGLSPLAGVSPRSFQDSPQPARSPASPLKLK
ncbi:hypothetical protein KIPB_006354, partial [Kipferlia bialata]|eukprot:g3454.t1